MLDIEKDNKGSIMDITVCPVCGTSDIERGDIGGSTLYDLIQECSCENCSSSWNIYFTATEIDITHNTQED